MGLTGHLSNHRLDRPGGSWETLLGDGSYFPTRHNYGLGLWQSHIERILAGWVDELAVAIYRGRGVTGFAQDTGVDVELAEELEWGRRRDALGIPSLSRMGDGGPVRRCDIL